MQTENSMKVVIPSSHDTVAPIPVRIYKKIAISTFPVTLSQILSTYGPDALRACYLAVGTSPTAEEVVLVPKMRKDMGEKAWAGLCPEFKGLVLKWFYEEL